MRKRAIMKAANDEVVVEDFGPEMKTFICSSCNHRFPDTGLYFYEIVSNRCLWCTKFPKAKNERKIT
jgi:hypothetical protein